MGCWGHFPGRGLIDVARRRRWRELWAPECPFVTAAAPLYVRACFRHEEDHGQSMVGL